MLHQRPETQTGEVQTLLGLLQEGVWQLPFLSGHEEVWWARAHEEGLHLETVFSGEASIVFVFFAQSLFICFDSTKLLKRLKLNVFSWTMELFTFIRSSSLPCRTQQGAPYVEKGSMMNRTQAPIR